MIIGEGFVYSCSYEEFIKKRAQGISSSNNMTNFSTRAYSEEYRMICGNRGDSKETMLKNVTKRKSSLILTMATRKTLTLNAFNSVTKSKVVSFPDIGGRILTSGGRRSSNGRLPAISKVSIKELKANISIMSPRAGRGSLDNSTISRKRRSSLHLVDLKNIKGELESKSSEISLRINSNKNKRRGSLSALE